MSKPKEDTHVVIFIKNLDIRKATEDSLRRLGMKKAFLFDHPIAARNKLKDRPDAFLILDWQGHQSVNLLEFCKNFASDARRPILLIADEEIEDMFPIVSEYFLSGLIPGLPSSQEIQREIVKILDAGDERAKLQEEMLHVSRARQKGDHETAAEILEKLYAASPRNTKIACELADLYFQQTRWEKCETLVEAILFEDHDNPRALLLRARLLLRSNQTREAADYLERSTILNPYHSDRLVEFGQVLLASNQPQKAIAQFEAALGLDPDLKEAKQGKAAATLLEGDNKEGLRLLKELASDRERAAVFNNSGIIAVSHKDFKAAHGLYDIGLQLIEDDELKARMAFNKGLAYCKNKEFSSGFKWFDRAIDLDPSFARAKAIKQKMKKISATQGGALENEWERFDEELDELEDLSDLDESL